MYTFVCMSCILCMYLVHVFLFSLTNGMPLPLLLSLHIAMFLSFSLSAVSTYHLKKSAPVDVNVTVVMNCSDDQISSFTAESLSWGIRKCQALVDCPPNVLHTDEYARQAQDIVKDLQANGYADTVSYQQFRGEGLASMGLFGIHGVGQGDVMALIRQQVCVCVCVCGEQRPPIPPSWRFCPTPPRRPRRQPNRVCAWWARESCTTLVACPSSPRMACRVSECCE